jgi:uncharacterized protein YbgA (DUF1722 family)/uncharacterized protein YbbK (DUF523 family)
VNLFRVRLIPFGHQSRKLTYSSFADEMPLPAPIKIGISSCLLGNRVRYDGGHKLDPYIRDTLGRYFTFIPVCPEVECGLPVPRESMRLVGDPTCPRLITNRSGIDHTARMLSWSRQKVRELESENLCGFIFKKDSPSSGMSRVRVYQANGTPTRTGSGLFAKTFMVHFARLPVEDEGRLHDPKLRENFIERIFACLRWRMVLDGPKTIGRLVDFHSREKLLILAHSPTHYRAMGRLVADGKKLQSSRLYDDYETLYLSALKLKTTSAKHTNVLQHIQGYFKKNLTADEKKELVEIIRNFHNGIIPLIVPITMVNHYVRKYQQPYLAQQSYLCPHPVDLQLRNHV